MLRAIRETIAYTAQFQGSRFVVKLDSAVSERAEEAGILSDVRLLHDIGIQMVLVHAVQDFDLALWPSIHDHAAPCDADDAFSILRLLLEKHKIPVVLCGSYDNKESDNCAVNLSVKLGADKLLLVTGQKGIVTNGNLIRQCNITQAMALLKEQASSLRHGMDHRVRSCIDACRKGVKRIHIISGSQEDSLIAEIFCSEGVGTMFYKGRSYRAFRRASVADISSIKEILHDSDVPSLSFGEIQKLLNSFWVLTADNHVQACFHLREDAETSSLEVSYLATSAPYSTDVVKREVLEWIFKRAFVRGLGLIFFRPDKHEVMLRIQPWFLDFGFKWSYLGKISEIQKLGYATEDVWFSQVNSRVLNE